ncbi:hypothetical protein KJ570_02590 [Patescibacteria group bacterium]|nr:hypothetical protein [Patescibacteria group bacterium]MBU2035836.1 hypothetical protein [Patescibacteria group bacterium]
MQNFWDKREILVSITTIGNGWKEKIKEIKKLKLEKVALFLTGLEYRNINKKELFSLLDDTSIKEIPFVHLMNKNTPEDIKYLSKRFKTKVFNIHSEKQYSLKYNLSQFKKSIYIENIFRYVPDIKEIEQFAGVCIDISHLEIAKYRYPKIYEKTIKALDQVKCGCNHISSYKENAIEDARYIKKSSHFFTNLSQFDYLLGYPKKYFSNLIALELENPISEQLKARKYIINLLKNKA